MSVLAANLTALRIGRRAHVGFGDDIPTEVPFCPPRNLATKLNNTPRYLFRVHSDASAGKHSSECMKSIDALGNNLTDIFARDNTANIAIALNEHLRWEPKSCGDPFISWTTSLLVAIEYAIYKYKAESVELQAIRLCIVDTTMFPKGVFIQDLDLIEEFYDKVPYSQQITVSGLPHTWEARGLGDFRNLRNKQHKTHSGVYYFGEFLSQGQTNIEGRSSTVTCDKIINNDLFAMLPQFKDELEDSRKRWADAVVESRESFYMNNEPKATSGSEFSAAVKIALHFGTVWFMPVLVHLLALRPRASQDPGILDRISGLFSDEWRYSLSSKDTNIVANENIPEVFQVGKIVHDINEAYWDDSAHDLLRSMEETLGALCDTNRPTIGNQCKLRNTNFKPLDIVRRFTNSSSTTGAPKLLVKDNLAGCLYTEHLQPLMQSLITLNGIIKELQEGTTSV
ncbi:hypothetical protein FOPG_10471 [Fusarium oxysporum f. sp. conglutinans race 2 54008]|uniref:DUF7587 domain-containing protein n=1 Tax=Fusarium oxysporum f. sp. conglutinans race 2 54008 TaxID=1089457 RepID=X0IMZ4_FUSOX|nr:hypothetical protein FOPG_10471 [Fusarium oxysporum f. sp. conglutinans race 2 54008]KAG6978769.1 hypothetical protein FocnCong_v011117 [Fusarium oxysporum f. sp. conglutinans]